VDDEAVGRADVSHHDRWQRKSRSGEDIVVTRIKFAAHSEQAEVQRLGWMIWGPAVGMMAIVSSGGFPQTLIRASESTTFQSSTGAEDEFYSLQLNDKRPDPLHGTVATCRFGECRGKRATRTST
jgi:hypothetical protein